MGWFTTRAVAEFLAKVGDFLRAEPARNTVVLSMTENLMVKAAAAGHAPAQPGGSSAVEGNTGQGNLPDGDEPLFGWWQPESGEAAGANVGGNTGRNGGGNTGRNGGAYTSRNTGCDTNRNAVRGAFMHTPGFPIFLTSMSSEAAAELAGLLAAARHRIPGVNAEGDAAEAFADTWRRRTGQAPTVHRRMRLHRLGALVRPDPAPEGASRAADVRDRDLLIEWFGAFAVEVDDGATQDHAPGIDERLSYCGTTIWEAVGAPVSVAGMTRAVAGMVRVGPVYTPPALRGRGYAGGATAAASQAALDAGATDVVLYTDLANPTSNALYERLGFRPVEDRLMLSFEPRKGS